MNMEKVITVKKLQEYDEAYDIGKSLIDDVEYDRLKELTKQKYSTHSYFKTVGTIVKEREIKLPYILGSLDKVNTDNILKWTQGKGYLTASEKIDGLSILCKWEKGIPVSLAKRGDGIIGQDITPKIDYFIPNINTDDTIWLRGEAVLIGDAYKKLGFKNNRNGTAGLLNRTLNEDSLSMIVPYFYEIVDAPYIPKEEYERFLYIKSLGLQTPDFTLITLQDMPKMVDILIDFLQQSKKYKSYDVDGIVLTKNLSNRENVLFPKDKVAFKIKGEEIIVTVNGITWQPSRFGKLKPVINIIPMKIGGVTVSNVTGFHANYILENNIGKDTVMSLIRAGDVIPHITGIIKSTKAKLPTKCPSCEGRLKIVNDDLVCQSIYCCDSGVKRAMYFLKTIGLKGYSEITIERIGIDDIFNVVNYDRIRRHSNYRLHQRYYRALSFILQTVPAYKILAGFGIPGVGLKVSMEICNFLEITNNHDFEKIFAGCILNIGEKTNKSFNDNICKYNILFTALVNAGLNIISSSIQSIGKLNGMNFVITGTHRMLRSDMVAQIEREGGKVSSTVTSKITMLIIAGYQSHTIKYKKAVELNIPMGDWYDFKEKYKI